MYQLLTTHETHKTKTKPYIKILRHSSLQTDLSTMYTNSQEDKCHNKISMLKKIYINVTQHRERMPQDGERMPQDWAFLCSTGIIKGDMSNNR